MQWISSHLGMIIAGWSCFTAVLSFVERYAIDRATHPKLYGIISAIVGIGPADVAKTLGGIVHAISYEPSDAPAPVVNTKGGQS